MGQLWTLATYIHSLAGPVMMLVYPLYASIQAIESPTKVDDEQWLAYWILYSFLTLAEMILEPVLNWIPIWYDIKLLLVAWLVLPQLRGAAFIYDKFVREKLLMKYFDSAAYSVKDHKIHNSPKSKKKLMDFMKSNSTSKKGEQEE